MTIYLLVNAWPDESSWDDSCIISCYMNRHKAIRQMSRLKKRDSYNYQYLRMISLRMR